jgi:hypothetical protein
VSKRRRRDLPPTRKRAPVEPKAISTAESASSPGATVEPAPATATKAAEPTVSTAIKTVTTGEPIASTEPAPTTKTAEPAATASKPTTKPAAIPVAIVRKHKGKPLPPPIAQGIGPRWLRKLFIVLACAYFAGLVKQPPPIPGLHALSFFTEATALFPSASEYSLEYKLEVWSCRLQTWKPADPRPYFPIEADSKESRFQRIGYFYTHGTAVQVRSVMNALDQFIVDHHPDVDDGYPGPIGGIQIVRVRKPIPEPGTEIERYVYRPLEPAGDAHEQKPLCADKPGDQPCVHYLTKSSERRSRCKAAHQAGKL